MSLAAPVSFSIVAGALPTGVNMDSSGFISGIPTTPGAFNVTIRATGSDGQFVQRNYTIGAIEIIPFTLPDATLGTPYAEALSADGTVGSLTWSITQGTLPDGLTLHPGTGVISGTPTTADTYDFTVAVMDSQTTCTKDYQILVSGGYMFWKMEEAGGNRVDSIQSVALVPFTTVGGNTVTGPAGKILNGVLLTKVTGSVGLHVGLATALVAPFAYVAGDSFSIVGWARRTSGTVAEPEINLTLDLYDDAIGSNWLTTIILNETLGTAQFFILDNVGAGFSNVNVATGHAVGTFFFFALLYDGATGLVSGQIDGGGLQVGAGVANLLTAPFGTLLLHSAGPAPAVSNAMQFDEVGFFPVLLTQAQVNYLYNAGAGQTSPIVFP